MTRLPYPGPAAAILFPQYAQQKTPQGETMTDATDTPRGDQLAEATTESKPDPERHPASSLSLSDSGQQFIEAREGAKFRGKVYPDTAGHDTIGFGHKLLKGEKEQFQNGIDEKTARDLLIKDLATAESAVQRLVKQPLTQHEYDALVSFVYNIGVGSVRDDTGFVTSTTLRKLNEASHGEAADALRLFNKQTVNGRKVENEGLRNRREAERDLFLNGNYGTLTTK